ncbi:hypothetical protein [Paenibacillus tyrfis]|uniref:hypothetical protein n=1 Tax=Paenibacillus tyrfis TaxID=1501230 RepID=UPI000B58FE3E|nr:hypothetical protein [Paenibacillus tyrfis]
MKKTSKILFMVILMLSLIPALAANAGPAPPLSSFQIVGFSWPALWNNGLQYYDKSYASQVKVPSNTVYIVTKTVGYGNLYYNGTSPNVVHRQNIVNANREVTGWYEVFSVSNLSRGFNYFNPYTIGVNGGGIIHDSINLDIQP